jgi:short-subunit dehydrogenase
MNVVITGASRGIGKAIAEVFAQNGANLWLVARNADVLMRAAGEIRSRYPSVRVEAKAFDLGRKEDAQSCGAWLCSAVDRIDVLVNNAGTFVPGNVTDEPDGALETMLAVNLCSAYHLTRAVAPKMMAARGGHIFTMGSIAGLQAYPGGGAYSISKFALIGFTRNLREELKPHGVKVTAVIPGAVYTDSWSGSGVAEDRIMTAEDIATLIYAASRLSAAATVEEILVRPQLGDL